MSSDTIPIRKGEELDLTKIEAFLRSQFHDLPDAPLTVDQFGFGRSNLTYQIKIGDWEAVLRRPPLGPVAPRAHDMKREFTILKELHPHYHQAPKPYALADEHVIGSPFIVMERKRGIVLEDKFPEGVEVTKELCRNISESIVDGLVALHAVDYTKTKLKDITKPEGFLKRQVEGWINRYERAKTDDVQEIEQLKKWMMSHIPVSPEPTIVHYDFKLNNVMFNHELNELIGVFDWEMTTVGDPLADLATSLTFWIEKNDSPLIKKDENQVPITSYDGFITREEFMEAYSRKSGRDVSNMNFYLTFAFFKLGVISQQIYYRWKKGQTQDERFNGLNRYVNNLMQYAHETVRKNLYS